MAPRTGPPSYNFYDDIDIDSQTASSPGYPSSYLSSTHLAAPSTRQDITETSHSSRTSRTNANNNNTRRNAFSILLHPPSIRRVLSSTTIQTAALITVYTICITTLWVIFCASYILTFYDDTKNLVRTSRVWSRVKHGVRERLSMMGEDWEGLAKKYFDQPWTSPNADASKNAHLNEQKNSGAGSSKAGNTSKTPEKEWEEWLKTMVYKFVSNVAGQETSNKFYQNSGRRFRPSAQTTAASNDGHR